MDVIRKLNLALGEGAASEGDDGRKDDTKAAAMSRRWEEIDEAFCNSRFPEQRDAWFHRLRWRLEKIAAMSIALRAYSELLEHELEELFSAWFAKDGRRREDFETRVLRSDPAPEVAPQTLIELRRLSQKTALIRSFDAVAGRDSVLPPRGPQPVDDVRLTPRSLSG